MKTAPRIPKTVSIVDRILDPLTRKLSPDAVQAIVDFRLDAKTQSYVSRLAEKCNEGELTANERAEYEAFVDMADLIAILQSKARQLLKRRKTG